MTPEGSRRLTILFVIDGLGTGGAERSLAEMLPHLADAGIRPIVACFHRRAEGVQAHVGDAFDVRVVDAKSTLGRALGVRKIVRAERPDLIHTTILEASLVGRIAGLGGPPVLSSLVSTPYTEARLRDPNISRWRMRVVQIVDGWTARHLTDRFHAISHAVKDHAVAKLGVDPGRVEVISRGRDPDRLGVPSAGRRRAARSALGLDESDEVLVHLGRQEFQKGQRYLLEAVERLGPRRPRLVVLMAGRRGGASSVLDRLRELPSVRACVRFLGHRDDAPEVLAAGDVFVYPSVVEGLGGALIEAMALGLPIVASDVPAIREVVEEGANALLVPPGDPDALAGRIAELLDDRDRLRRFGDRSRAIYGERFTLEQSVTAMVGLYRRVVEVSPTP